SAVYPWVLRTPGFGRILFCQSLFPLGRFIEDRTDPKGRLSAGGSVATSAWDFCRFLNPSAIWIAGLDLAFPGYRTHYRGALFEENAHALSRRTFPAETISVKTLENGIPFAASSGNSGRVLTDKRLSLYAAWFENQIENSSQTQAGIINYNLSPDGLNIPGMICAKPADILALPERRKDIDQLLKITYCRIEEDYHTDELNRKMRYSRARSILFRSLEEIRERAEDAASVVKHGLMHSGLGKRETEKILLKLDKANAAISRSPVKDAAGFLFPPIAELEKQQQKTEALERHLEFSLLFYRSLAESVEYTLEVLKTGVM
ncbi:MAG: hypothetical protein LBH43_08420, partial [Treponema sp.]|nr:hypothetical protein [Treponema sp.]